MKKIINGKMYNTETAECVEWYTNGLSKRDFCYKEEGIYRKKTGEWFLYGEGGAMTEYAEHLAGTMRGYGEGIIPLTLQEAKEWCEKHADIDTYIKYFGEVEE